MFTINLFVSLKKSVKSNPKGPDISVAKIYINKKSIATYIISLASIIIF
jgi:hypothetical protein